MKKSCGLGLATTITLTAITPVVSAQDLDNVVDRASAYIVALGEKLSTVLADEHYLQTYRPTATAPIEERRLWSEFALVRVVDRDEWVGFRDVMTVDGRRVRDRDNRLARLFLQRPENSLARGRAIADESARFNLGPVVRNFNVPTAALFLVHPANAWRFQFTEGHPWCDTSTDLCQLSFEEHERPTLIRTPTGTSVPIRGFLWIDLSSDRIVRTELQAHLRERQLDVMVEVRYGYNSTLDLLVPVEMRETYNSARGDQTTGIATYNGYRRFSVDARVVRP